MISLAHPHVRSRHASGVGLTTALAFFNGSSQASRRGIYGGNCWDWCGETAADFDTRGGVQLNMVLRMLADMPRIVRESGLEQRG